MTVTPPGMPGGQYTAHAPNFQPTPPIGPAGPVANPASTAARGSRLAAAGAITALLVAIAALVVAIIAVNRPNSQQAKSAPPTTNSAQTTDTTDADRSLCSAIAPLMSENNNMTNDYARLGDAGTPARDAATPKFIRDTKDWISRIQPVVDEHPGADPFFRRSMQRFIDDQNLIVADLQPGPLTSFAKSLWSDSTGAYSGPVHSCEKLGIKW